jgi:hypothetical protein
MPKSKEIDFLFEDPVIPQQRYALVTIVGPHMNQKCNVWGMKVRGVADSIEKARMMTQKLMKIDNNYDVYTVEVGKFFPLTVEPHGISDVEYQNDQLNTLMKSYLENRELANEHWHQRKNELIKDAIKEGKEQERLSQRPEHPIAVLQRIKSYEEKVESMTEMLRDAEEGLMAAREKYASYSEEERQIAAKQVSSAINANATPDKKDSIETIRKELVQELTLSSNNSATSEVPSVLADLSAHENELSELEVLMSSIDEIHSPIIYKKTQNSISKLTKRIEELKTKLQNQDVVNDFINSNYQQSELNVLMNS